MSLLSAWIVAQLRRRNLKRLQGQDRQSIMCEKLVGGIKGRPGAGQGREGEIMTPGYSPCIPQQPSAKVRPGQAGRVTGALGGVESGVPHPP